MSKVLFSPRACYAVKRFIFGSMALIVWLYKEPSFTCVGSFHGATLLLIGASTLFAPEDEHEDI